jgi:hemin uptake protein HemP
MKTQFSPVSGPVAGEHTPRNERAPVKPRRVRIEDLLGGGRELIIEHRNEEYRLRMTSNSKLILTK